MNRILLLCLLAAFSLCGCDDGFDLKAPTQKTPPSREGQRHSLDSAALFQPARPLAAKVARRPQYLKAGFIFLGKTGDYGFAYSQNRGRLALEETLGIQTMALENIAEDERALAAMEELIAAGCNIIFSTGYGFVPYSLQMAEKNPDVIFFNCAGEPVRPNLAQYFGRMYQVRYLTGIVAGMRTETGRIGYVAGRPIPEVVRGLDAFGLGVKLVNPGARIHVRWSGTWYDPGLERRLALQLIGRGCDVIAQHQDSVAAQVAAEEMGVWSIGYHSSMDFFAPNGYLTGASWNWAPYMIREIKAIENGGWEPSRYWGGLKDQVVRLDPLTVNVAPGTEKVVAEEKRAIISGYDVFSGPIYDNEGNLRVPAGRTLTDREKLSLDWFVDNIIAEPFS